MSTEEQRRKRRERYARKKEWRAILEKWVEFAAAQVRLKREEREQESEARDFQVGDRVQIESDDDFNGESGAIKIIDDGVVFWVLVQTRLVPCEEHELATLEDSEEQEGAHDGTAGL